MCIVILVYCPEMFLQKYIVREKIQEVKVIYFHIYVIFIDEIQAEKKRISLSNDKKVRPFKRNLYKHNNNK